jgi:Domain of unknown function (DUF4926)
MKHLQRIKELDRVVLCEPMQIHGLVSGDVGTVVLVHQEGKSYEVEFIALDGETVAVLTLSANQVRPILPNELTHARSYVGTHH